MEREGERETDRDRELRKQLTVFQTMHLVPDPDTHKKRTQSL